MRLLSIAVQLPPSGPRLDQVLYSSETFEDVWVMATKASSRVVSGLVRDSRGKDKLGRSDLDHLLVELASDFLSPFTDGAQGRTHDLLW